MPLKVYLPSTSRYFSVSEIMPARNGGTFCLASISKCFKSSSTDSSVKNEVYVYREDTHIFSFEKSTIIGPYAGTEIYQGKYRLKKFYVRMFFHIFLMLALLTLKLQN